MPGMPALNTSPEPHGRSPHCCAGCMCLPVCGHNPCSVQTKGVQCHFGTVARFTGEIPVFIGTAVAQGVVVRPGLQFTAQRKGSGFGGGPVNRLHHFDTVAGCRQPQSGITGIGEIQPVLPVACPPSMTSISVGKVGSSRRIDRLKGAVASCQIRDSQRFRDKRTVCRCWRKTDGSGVIRLSSTDFTAAPR